MRYQYAQLKRCLVTARKPLRVLPLLCCLGLVACSAVAHDAKQLQRGRPALPIATSTASAAQGVLVHLVVKNQDAHIVHGQVTLYVTLAITNARTVPIGLLPTCIVYSLQDMKGNLVWGGAGPCPGVVNVDLVEIMPGHTYDPGRVIPLYLNDQPGYPDLQPGEYVLAASYIRWNEGTVSPDGQITGKQGYACGQSLVLLS
jgi:hypothetical protein